MNALAPKQVSFKTHKKQYRLSDYLQAERDFLGRVAFVAFIALALVAYGLIGAQDFADRALSLGGM
jgi:hypothetical protein